MGYDLKLVEESLKLKVAKDFFNKFDTTDITDNIDFMVADSNANKRNKKEYYLWAEAKRGNKSDIYASIVQLILTIGKAEMKRSNLLPPHYFGAFDAEKIAFLPNYKITSVFSQNDFNWNVTPSDHETKEFKQIYEIAKDILERESLIFYYDKNKAQLKEFIKKNFVRGNVNTYKIQITKNNFKNVYYDWLESVKPTISIDWENEKPEILDTDFYIADLLSRNNNTEEIRENIRILLKGDYYKVKVKREKEKDLFSEFHFTDGQKAHLSFWNNYERPPKEEAQDYIIYRRDELVPQDIRERKGAYFTPRIWVKKAQEYLAQALGENYQDEYYFWDCAAGSGNLLVGLNDKYRIFVSTLDKSDVDGMIDRIKDNKCDLLESHVFQFDFLNDDFSKLPKELSEIIKNEPQKLIIFINPPYAEATSANTTAGTGQNKSKVATFGRTYEKYSVELNLGLAIREIFAQFFIRIYKEIPNCILASFGKLKYVNSSGFIYFRENFKAKFLKGFICPADTFDNVKGKFPIGFLIWDTSKKEKIENITVDIYDIDNNRELSENTDNKGLQPLASKSKENQNTNEVNSLQKKSAQGVRFCAPSGKTPCYIGKKNFYAIENSNIHQWRSTFPKIGEKIGYMISQVAPDFQNNKQVAIVSKPTFKQCLEISEYNLMYFSVYFAVRHSIEPNWINDRDVFLYPNDKWEEDKNFQNDCLAFALFHGQNRISSSHGVNNWIPFSENEVNSKKAFTSHFMKEFIDGKIKPKATQGVKTALLSETKSFIPTKPIEFSAEAKNVFNAGLKLWKYYHKNCIEKSYNANASLYDIKEYFQGRNEKGKMNNKSKDEEYNKLIGNLRSSIGILAKKIEPKIYEYGFLRE